MNSWLRRRTARQHTGERPRATRNRPRQAKHGRAGHAGGVKAPAKELLSQLEDGGDVLGSPSVDHADKAVQPAQRQRGFLSRSPSSHGGSRLYFPQPRGRTLGLERLPSWPSSCPLNVRPGIPDTVQLEHTLGISSYTRRDSHPEAPSGDVVAPLQSACRILELIPSSDQRSKRIDHTSA